MGAELGNTGRHIGARGVLQACIVLPVLGEIVDTDTLAGAVLDEGCGERGVAQDHQGLDVDDRFLQEYLFSPMSGHLERTPLEG